MAMRHLWCACTKFQPNPASRRVLSRSQSGNGSRKTTRIIPSVSNNQILKAMRKSFVYAAGLMCLALSITDCQKELVDQTTPASEPNFELFAQPVTTKTANNGLDTKWVAEDAINVFHAEAGSTAYDSDGRFTVKDIETGRFDGTVSKSLSADKSYDWYAFYPYSSYNKTPAGISKDTFGYTTIGGTSQTQTGNGSRAHLAGESCPLYGIASNVASDKVPSIEMNHLTSVIKVSVTNNSGEDLTVSSVSFTGTEDIVGTYFINFAASPVAYKSRGNAYVSSTTSLTVSNGEALANGSSADFYIALKPFTAKTGSTLKLAVNGYEKTLTLKNDITFTAGHIKPLNFNYDTSLKTATFNFADPESLGLTKPSSGKGTEIKAPIVKGDITLKTTDGTTPTRIWNAKEKCELRVYKEGSLTFSSIEGYVIKSIVFTGKAADNSLTVDTGSYGSLTWTGSAQSVKFTANETLNIISATITYEKGVTLPALVAPAVEAEVQNNNSIYVIWSSIDGAKDYTVTCGAQSITLAGTEHTFTDLAYSTSYTISVVANPADASVNAPSAAGTASITTGANPSSGKVTFGDDWNALFATSYNGAFNPKANELSLNGEKNGVSINVTNGTSINGYIKKTDFRAYNGYTIMLSAPEGKSITAVSTTKGGKAFTTGIKADKGTGSISNNTFSWKGSVQSLKLTISGTVSFATIDVTYE